MVVAAVFVGSEEQQSKLEAAGIRDSKTISDSSAVKLRKTILEVCPYSSEVVISPQEYNEKYEKLRNVNVLLAQGHAVAIEEVLEDLGSAKCEKVVVDQFSKSKSRLMDELLPLAKQLPVEQRYKGESDLAVAAASIVARGRYLQELDALSKKFNTKFPKGASQVIEFGKDFYAKHGYEALKQVAKISFKTTLQITSTFNI